jgi:type VI secretion system protein ImpK
MSGVANKTMLVPVNTGNESLTDFGGKQESYSSFKNNTMANAVRDNKGEGSYEGSGNPLMSLAGSIFKRIDVLQHSYDIGSLEEVKDLLIEDINYFTEATAKKGIENSEVMLARYVLCTFSDELICTTYWGKDNNWANSSLLGHFYNETYGGEKFFQILDQLLRAPAKYIDLLEVMYICLSLGFEGKYRIQNRGKMELDSIRDSLYRQMKMMGIRDTQTFYAPQKASSERNHLIYKTSYQILGASLLVLLALVYGVLTFSLSGKENKVKELLQNKYNKYAASGGIVQNLASAESTVVVPARNAPSNNVPEPIVIKGINE